MPKQKWVNDHAMEDWELENTRRADDIIDEYWRKDEEKWRKEEAKNILETGKPWKEDF